MSQDEFSDWKGSKQYPTQSVKKIHTKAHDQEISKHLEFYTYT